MSRDETWRPRMALLLAEPAEKHSSDGVHECSDRTPRLPLVRLLIKANPADGYLTNLQAKTLGLGASTLEVNEWIGHDDYLVHAARKFKCFLSLNNHLIGIKVASLEPVSTN